MTMLDPATSDYAVTAILTDGTHTYVPVTALAWEELTGEVATRISLEFPDAQVSQGWLSTLIGLGTPITVLASLGDGSVLDEVARGTIWDMTPPDGIAATFKAVAYDSLESLLRSQIDRWYPAGKTLGFLVRDLVAAYNIPLGQMSPLVDDASNPVTGAPVTLGIQLIRGKTIAAVLTDWIDEFHLVSGKRLATRSNKGFLEIIAPGSNDKVYWVKRNESSLGMQEQVSISAMVTRVVVLGKKTDKGRTPVIAVLNGDQRLGVWTETMYVTKHSTLGEVEASARTILNEKGVPSDQRTLVTFDAADVRKFDSIRVTDGTTNGHVLVEGVTHDAVKKQMSLVLGNLVVTPTQGDFTMAEGGQAVLDAVEDTDPADTSGGGISAGSGASNLDALIAPWLGTRYLWGGNTKAGVDCSGFTVQIFKSLGVTLPRTAQGQYNATKRVTPPQIGDLVFFSGTDGGKSGDFITHVGIFVGNGMMVSAIEPVLAKTAVSYVSGLVGYGRP